MKIRHSFVSNSSSTSYTIMINEDKNKPCEHCGRKDPNFIEILKIVENC